MIYAKKSVFLHKILISHLRALYMTLPANPDMLVSFVNMKLRNEYTSLEAMCEDLSLNPDELIQRLRNAGYEYSQEAKRFW